MTRAMLVTVLWSYQGSPNGYYNSFSDVKNGQWYTAAVAWAATKGVVSGVGNNNFAPNGTITREQLATILFSFAKMKGISATDRASLSKFPDGNKTSSWAKEAVQWAVAKGLLTGSVVKKHRGRFCVRFLLVFVFPDSGRPRGSPLWNHQSFSTHFSFQKLSTHRTVPCALRTVPCALNRPLCALEKEYIM